MPESPFTSIHHICLVVNDMDEAINYWESLGVTGWQDFPPLSDFTNLSSNYVDFDTLTYKFANLDNFQLQLCHPGPGATAQRRFLDERGPGVYHLGFGTPDVDAAERSAAATGLTVRSSGRRDDGTGFTYFETEGTLGVTLEVRSPA
jgi:methylmalonyl-CoA/ethylmalonyl-CoA epimerase